MNPELLSGGAGMEVSFGGIGYFQIRGYVVSQSNSYVRLLILIVRCTWNRLEYLSFLKPEEAEVS